MFHGRPYRHHVTRPFQAQGRSRPTGGTVALAGQHAQVGTVQASRTDFDQNIALAHCGHGDFKKLGAVVAGEGGFHGLFR